MLKAILFAALALVSLGNMAAAEDANVLEKAEAFAKVEMRRWAADPVIVAAIHAANDAHAGYDRAQVDALDKQWMAEVGAAAHPLVDAAVANPVSAKLKEICEENVGLVTEAFVMDAKSLIVGMCRPTSDYWQGDEPKWQKTFPSGPDAVFIDGVEEDKSTGKFQVQTSITVVDPATGEPIGAMTVGLDAETLMAK